MKNLRHFLRRLRILVALVATLIFFLTVLLPPVLGLITRQIIIDRSDALRGVMLADFNIESVNAEPGRAGWFSSEIIITASGPALSADGQSSVERHGILYINHGPVIWHLSDTLLALADMQLLPLAYDSGPEQHFSGSAIVTLTPLLVIQLKAIAGIQASGGEHWIELRSSSPLPPLPGQPSQEVWLDLDIAALRAAGLSNQLERWQLAGDARVSNNRLLFNIGPQ